MHIKKSHLLLFAIIALAISSAHAQAPQTAPNPADALIDAAIANANAGSSNDYKYTYTEDWQTVDNDMNKAFPVTHTTEYEISYIDIVPFRRKVSIERYPLDAPSVELENKRYAAEQARINALAPADHLKALRDPAYLYFSPALLKGYYTCQITGQKTIDKRPTTVVDCKLRPEIIIAPNSRAFMPGAITFWIDKQQPFFNRTHMLLTADAGPFGKGTELLFQYNLVDGVWQHTSTRIDFKDLKNSVYGGVIIDTFSRFKKITSESTFAPGFKFTIPPPQPQPKPDPNASGSQRGR
jgi:hypothetical protein